MKHRKTIFKYVPSVMCFGLIEFKIKADGLIPIHCINVLDMLASFNEISRKCLFNSAECKYSNDAL